MGTHRKVPFCPFCVFQQRTNTEFRTSQPRLHPLPHATLQAGWPCELKCKANMSKNKSWQVIDMMMSIISIMSIMFSIFLHVSQRQQAGKLALKATSPSPQRSRIRCDRCDLPLYYRVSWVSSISGAALSVFELISGIIFILRLSGAAHPEFKQAQGHFHLGPYSSLRPLVDSASFAKPDTAKDYDDYDDDFDNDKIITISFKDVKNP